MRDRCVIKHGKSHDEGYSARDIRKISFQIKANEAYIHGHVME
jgi:hypothetical protein